MIKKYNEDDRKLFVELFRNNATDVSRACKAFGIARKTFYEWVKVHPDFAAAIDEAREEIRDFAESQLLTLMKGIPKLDEKNRIIGWVERPDTAAIIFFNKTRNKDRGYDERHIIKPEGGLLAGGITINVTKPEQADALKQFLENGTKGPGSEPQ